MRHSFSHTSPPSVNTPYGPDGRHNPPPLPLDFNPRDYPLFPASQGWRHPQLIQFAGHLRYHGYEEHELAEQLFEADRRFNALRKAPGEIKKIAKYAADHWVPGAAPQGTLADEVSERALGWLVAHCFDPVFAGVRGCVDFAVLYCCIAIARRARCVDFHAACRDIALAAHCTATTAARSLRRLHNAGFLQRIGTRKMDQAQQYSLGIPLCIHPHTHSWVELTSAMFGVSRAATKLQLLCGDSWMTTSLKELATRTFVGQRALRVASCSQRSAARRALARKGLKSLKEADEMKEVEDWRTALWIKIVDDRKLYAIECRRKRLKARRLGSQQRGTSGRLVLVAKA